MAAASGWGVTVPPRTACGGPSSTRFSTRSRRRSCGNMLFRFGGGVLVGGKVGVEVAARRTSVCCKCGGGGGEEEWDWGRWSRHFAVIEQVESYTSVLQFQLEDAIEKEDFKEAAKLKNAIAEITSKDSVAEIMSQFEIAINEERYHDASSLSRRSGSGLIGWWVGFSTDSDDPFGKLVRITPGVGRFVAKSYTPRQLVNATPGTPLFEIFVVKDSEEGYTMQVVYMHPAKGKAGNSVNALSKSVKGPSVHGSGKSPVVDIEVNQKATKNGEKGINLEEATEEGIRSVINFLKDKIPGLKVNVMNVQVEDSLEDTNAVDNLMQDDDEEEEDEVDEISESEIVNLEDVEHEITIGAEGDVTDEEKNSETKIFIGGVVHNKDDIPSNEEIVRVPAEITNVERNSFELYIPGIRQYQDSSEKDSKVRIAAIAAQGVAELMPPDVAKAFFGADKVSPKVSREVRDIVKLAVSQAQKKNRMPESTIFSRLTTSNNVLDPFEGLYIGAFGPYGTEVVQLKRKFGHWNSSEDEGTPSDLDFFEYVEAVKLTGDLNVPAGQVSFRAKIGKGKRNPNRGLYPDELGVLASYKGQGRIAEFGFKNPQWVEGELLQLSGKI
uniref:Protein EXECUTER 2, chloroplastic n=2 Tax=Kalanchoe fedtschenkoi TaxID=63787 RepID=A0A7N0T5D2_KALFE